MLENWKDIIITDIKTAICVAAGSGIVVCNNRNSHGFIINDDISDREYIFSDGTVLKTPPNSIFYFPKNSNYRVKTITNGDCWAINFDLAQEINEKPFVVIPKNPSYILENFKEAANTFKNRTSYCNLISRKNLYDIVTKIIKHVEKSYLPNRKLLLIKPAIDTINIGFTKNDMSVSGLAQLCGISEAYFRRIFLEIFSVSPKEYIITRRIEYAKLLLADNQFSISQIAELCGYAEPCYFSREFSRICKMSPKAYKNILLSKDN